MRLPPSARSRAALGLTAAAALGRFELQVCAECRALQYPPREVCHRCLCGNLEWQEQSGDGELISGTVVRHSQDAYFRERLPWPLGMVRLDSGPTAVVHLHAGCSPAPSRVRVGARLDRAGQGVLIAFPMNEVATMADDPELREMTCDPKSRNVLVTDAATAPGQALVRALVAAGAGSVWAGHAGDALPDLAQSSGVTRVALDVSDSASVKRAAAEIGGKVDILINTAQARGTGGANSRTAIDSARGEMDINYFGLLRLAQEFGPHMRAERPRPGAVAWVNVLSIYALTNFPAHGTFSASQAAALSLSQCLRVEMRPAGIRVVNVFPGPLDEESNRALPPPKLGHNALASAVVAALRDGIEDVYPGDVAQDWLARFRESPKILEREMSL